MGVVRVHVLAFPFLHTSTQSRPTNSTFVCGSVIDTIHSGTLGCTTTNGESVPTWGVRPMRGATTQLIVMCVLVPVSPRVGMRGRGWTQAKS